MTSTGFARGPFDSLLHAERRAHRGAGGAVALAVHGAVLAAALLWSRPRELQAPPDAGPVVIFEPRQPSPPRPPGPPPLQRGPSTGRPPKQLPRARLSQPVAKANAPPPAPAPFANLPDEPDAAGDPDGPPDGSSDGAPGGVPGGTPGGVPGGAGADPAPARVELDGSTLSIQLLDPGTPIEYPAQAVEHEVEGTMLVKCLLTREGTVRECRVLRSLPFMDSVVIHALESRRYAPVRLGGRPVEVDYTFRLQLTLPR